MDIDDRCVNCHSHSHKTLNCQHETMLWRYNILEYAYASKGTLNNRANYAIFRERVYECMAPELIRTYGIRYTNVSYSASLEEHIAGFWSHYMTKNTDIVVEESAEIEEFVPAEPVIREPFECGICLVKKKPKCAAKLPCKHLFCKSCVQNQKTIQVNPVCGICRGPLC